MTELADLMRADPRSEPPPNWKETLGFVGARVIVIAMLLYATEAWHPRGYFTLLRWATTLCGVWGVLYMRRQGRTGWAWFFVVTALLFNPILPFHLNRKLWVTIDLLWGAGFSVSLLFFRPTKAVRTAFLSGRPRTADPVPPNVGPGEMGESASDGEVSHRQKQEAKGR